MSSSVVADPDSAAALIRLQRRGPSPGCLLSRVFCSYRAETRQARVRWVGGESEGLEVLWVMPLSN